MCIYGGVSMGLKNKLKRVLYNFIRPFIENDFEKKLIEKSNFRKGKNVFVHKSAIMESIFSGEITIGDNTSINLGVCIMTYGGNIDIGENCDINPYTIIYGHGGTIIGNNVLIAGHCMIIPSNHNFGRKDIPIIQQGNNSKGIVIEDDVWIAHGCTILDGVIIGKGSIVAAGSVVNKSIPPYSIVGGVPANVLKTR